MLLRRIIKERLMKWTRSIGNGCDALDVAALWPSTAQLAGLPLPDIKSTIHASSRSLDG
jgi:hypothetical protein